MSKEFEPMKVRRELVDGEWHSIFYSDHVIIDAGRDDQRPDSDGVSVFQPVCVAQMIGDFVYSHHFFCGSCGKRIGSMGETRKFCPECGDEIGHYVFDMGVMRVQTPLGASFPEDIYECRKFESPCARREP